MLMLTALAACGKEEDKPKKPNKATETPEKPEATKSPTAVPTVPIPSGMKMITCREQEYSVIVKDEMTYRYEDGDGLYIYIADEGYIPYGLIWRMTEESRSAEEYLRDWFIGYMRDSYGDDLVEISDVNRESFGGVSLPYVFLQYMVGDTPVYCMRAVMEQGSDLISFQIKFTEDFMSESQELLEQLVTSYTPLAAQATPAPTPSSKRDSFQVIASEASSVKLTKYQDPNGYFTMSIPKGWEVALGGELISADDFISFTISAYDKKHPERMVRYQLTGAGPLKSQDAVDWYNKFYKNNPLAKMPYAEEVSLAGMLKALSGYMGFSDVKALAQYDNTPWGAELIRFSWKCNETNQMSEGLASALVTDREYMVQKNMFDYTKGFIDVGEINCYQFITLTSMQGEFCEWQPVLEQIFASIQFSKSFHQERNDAWKRLMGTTASALEASNTIGDMLMDTWEKSNRSYDISSEKQTDATLGYERVYDTKTGEYYRATAGFSDWYDGSRYQAVTKDAGYLEPVTGYIEWK